MKDVNDVKTSVLPLLDSAADVASVSSNLLELLTNGELGLRALIKGERQARWGEMFDATGIYGMLPKTGPIYPRVARFAGLAAIAAGDSVLFDRVLADMSVYAQKDAFPHAALGMELVECEFRLRLHCTEGLPGWLLDRDFVRVPEEWGSHVAQLVVRRLLVERSYEAALAAGGVLGLGNQGYGQVEGLDIWLKLANSICCRELGREAEMARWMRSAAIVAAMSGCIAPYVELVQGRRDPMLLDLKEVSPVLAARVRELEKPYCRNAIKLRNHWLGHNVSDRLSRREMLIASHLANGCSYQDIARMLSLSLGRVRNITTRIYAQLNVHRRDELQGLVW